MFLTLLKREFSLHLAGVGELLAVPALYVLAVTFYVMSQPHGEVLGASAAAAILWVASLLALGLTQYRIYERDAEDGTLEQWCMLPLALEMVVAAKLLAHWLMTGIPLMLLAPLLGMLLGMPMTHAPLPMALGTLALTALGSVAGAMSLRFTSRQLVTLLLVFPLSVPVVVFGASALLADGHALQWLLAYSLATVPLSVLISAGVLRIAVKY